MKNVFGRRVNAPGVEGLNLQIVNLGHERLASSITMSDPHSANTNALIA